MQIARTSCCKSQRKVWLVRRPPNDILPILHEILHCIHPTLSSAKCQGVSWILMNQRWFFFRFDRETHRIDNTYFASEKYTQIILLAIPIESVKFKNSYLCVVHGIHEVGRCCIFINFMKCEIALCIIFRCTYLFSRSSTQSCLVTLSLALCVCNNDESNVNSNQYELWGCAKWHLLQKADHHTEIMSRSRRVDFIWLLKRNVIPHFRPQAVAFKLWSPNSKPSALNR